MYLLSALRQCHYYLRKYIQEGDLVVDATAGNGHDTLLLAKLVGPQGKVLSIDIQEEALKRSRELLSKEGYLNIVELIKGNHAQLDKLVQEEVQAVVFNLGYLPKGDHSIVTQPPETIEAIKKALDLIKSKGILAIVSYHGHETGKEEKKLLEEYLRTIEQNYATVLKYEFINQINYPPLLYLVEKI